MTAHVSDMLREFLVVTSAHRTPTALMRRRALAALAEATGRTEEEVAGEIAKAADDLRHDTRQPLAGLAGAGVPGTC